MRIGDEGRAAQKDWSIGFREFLGLSAVSMMIVIIKVRYRNLWSFLRHVGIWGKRTSDRRTKVDSVSVSVAPYCSDRLLLRRLDAKPIDTSRDLTIHGDDIRKSPS